MGEPISGVAGGALSQQLDAGVKQTRQQGGGNSFESVLQQSGQNSGEDVQTTGTQAPSQAPSQAPAGQELGQVPEAARVDLMRRVGSLPPGAPNVLALLPDLFGAKKQTNWIREALNGVGNSPRAADLRGSLGNLEQQWGQIDTVLKSGKDMTQADLLVLQGRLYQLTQHVEVLSKVVDQMTGGVKTILNTNV